jgi:phosphoribosylformylglycinamidine synthase subunit PurSL
MVHRIEIRPREGTGEAQGDSTLHQVRELGVESVRAVRAVRLFFLFGGLSKKDARRAAEELLIDPVIETFTLGGAGVSRSRGKAASAPPKDCSIIEVHLKTGVMDPVAASTRKALQDMGLAVTSVRTARRHELEGRLTKTQREAIARKLLANPVIEDIHFESFTPPEVHGNKYKLKVTRVHIRELDDAALMELVRRGELFLNLAEMKAIQEYYRALGREPSDVELEMIAQTWSEHCGHKTFRGDVRVRDGRGRVIEEIPNLIKSTIFAATQKLAKPWCISVFQDNAGVIEFDEENAVCFKVETHNHPSAIEPYGGASTGIGGVIRDPMGTGMGARPFANTDVFCFGPPDMPAADVPKGVAHPRRLMRGVVAGVRDYGNRMGIPTVNGAVYFDERYVGNPLVFCGTAGIMPRGQCFKKLRAGDAILVVGGRTGRDGIHGATFSSGELTHAHETAFSHAVQIGNAITEKKMLDTIMQARDMGLYSSITDCGAGGLSSAVGELGAEVGAEVHLDRVPLKYAGLSYAEIWISEAQERMVLAVPRKNVRRILKVFESEGVEATVIGTFGGGGRPGTGKSGSPARAAPMLRLYYAGALVGELDMRFLWDGLPRPTKDAVWAPKPRKSPIPRPRKDYGRSLLKILALPNVASKEWIVRQYDHEVQGGSALKPLVGASEDGPGDAAVVRPVLGSRRGVVLSCGMNPLLGDLDPYQSALHAVDEALRNCVAVGGDLDRAAILDNFCWGNCDNPLRMGQLVQSIKGCHDAALAYGTPFISGKDSLNNEFRTESGETIAIPPTLLISAMSVIEDVSACVSADAKEPGNLLFLLGETGGEMGGSHFLLAEGRRSGNDVPPVDAASNARTMRALQRAIRAGVVRACHDLSEGGLAVSAAEMAFAGGVGVELGGAGLPAAQSRQKLSDAAWLFNESAGRFLVEVPPAKRGAFTAILGGCPCLEAGRVTDARRIVIARGGHTLIDVPISDAKAAWQGTFRET